MSDRYSFTENPVLLVLSRIHRLVPGLNKAIGVYYKTADHSPAAYVVNHPDAQSAVEQMEINHSAREALLPYLKFKSGHYWFSPDEMPFQTGRHQIRQMEILSELSRNVLLVVSTTGSGKEIVLFILYVTNTMGPFRISSNKPLSVDNKSIIGLLATNSITDALATAASDKHIFEGINDNTRSLAGSFKQARQQTDMLRSKYAGMLADYCRLYVKEHTESEELKYQLTADALDKICTWEGELETLKEILGKAIGFARNLSYGTEPDVVMIEDYHIDMNVKKAEIKKTEVITLPSRYLKTIELLDRLEAAAKLVKAQHADLTGANVGRACARPVSAPAITEALQKHSAKIIELLKQYPSRWEIIRSDFRPLSNILSAATLLPGEKEMSA